MDIIKVGILGVAAVFLAIPLRKEKQEYSMFLSMAVCICQVQEDAFDTHSYLEKMKKNSVEFQSITRVARARYALPSCISVKN